MLACPGSQAVLAPGRACRCLTAHTRPVTRAPRDARLLRRFIGLARSVCLPAPVRAG